MGGGTQESQTSEDPVLRPVRAQLNMLSGMVPRNVPDLQSALTRMMGPARDPSAWLGEVVKGTLGQVQNFKALQNEPAFSQNWWNAAVPTAAGYAGMVAPFTGEFNAATGGGRLPQAGESGSVPLPGAGKSFGANIPTSYRRGPDWGNTESYPAALNRVTGANIREALDKVDFGDATHADLAHSLGKIDDLPGPLNNMVKQYHADPDTFGSKLEGMARRYAAPVFDYPPEHQ